MIRPVFVAIFLAAGIAGAWGAPAPERPPAVAPRPGSFAELVDTRSACRLKPWRTLQASGWDRGGGFMDSGNFLREEPDHRYVMLDERGPGVIDRMWFTRKSTREPWDLLLYLDGATEPTLRIDLDTLCANERSPFLEPFAGKVDLARFCYVPLGFRKGCKAVLQMTAPPERYSWRQNSRGEKIPHVYYQLTYRKLPSGTPLRPFRADLEPEEFAAMKAAAAAWRDPANAASTPEDESDAGADVHRESVTTVLPPGGRLKLLDYTGAGIIRRLQLQLPPDNPTRSLRLEMYWDEASNPAVSVPAGLYFAAPDPGVEVSGFWMGSGKQGYYSRYPMPFRRSARIDLVSEADVPVPVDSTVRILKERPREKDAYFHAVRYDHQPPLGPSDYRVLDATGKGHWVGIVVDRPGNMEGDDRFCVDDERKPSIHGTGTEDFFNFAWGFAHLGSLPLHGITRHDRAPVLYRTHLPAGVPFKKHLRLQWEHGSENMDTRGRYSGVAYYYSTSP